MQSENFSQSGKFCDTFDDNYSWFNECFYAITLCVLLSSAILRRYLSAQQFVWVSFSEQGLRVGGGGEGVGGVYKTPIRGRQKESISATHLGDFPRILSFAWHKILPVFLYHGLCCQIK